MRRISNTFIIFITICILTCFIGYKTFIQAKKEHDELLIYALESKVEYKAKRCYLEKKCKGIITLKDLYDKKYLEELINPVTKEVINSNTSISYNQDKIKVNWIY